MPRFYFVDFTNITMHLNSSAPVISQTLQNHKGLTYSKL